MGPDAIDVEELEELLGDETFLLDVRQPDEYQDSHVPGAVLMPLGELAARVAEVPAEGRVFVICHSGGRSRKATEALRSVGIDACNVVGGTQAWIDADKPVISGPAPA